MNFLRNLFLVTTVFLISSENSFASTDATEPAAKANILELTVTGMTCQSCSNAIQGSVGKLPHVASVTADHQSGKVIVSCDTTCPESTEVAAVIEKLGYQVSKK